MKHPNHFGRWLACVLLCLLLAGCSMPGEQVQVEELLRAPKLSGDYGDVQTALNDWLGESAQLKSHAGRPAFAFPAAGSGR